PCRQQALDEVGRWRGPDRAIVESGASSALGGEKFFSHRIIDDAEYRFALVLKSDGDAEDGEAVGVVGCSIERIYHPAVIGSAFCQAALLGQHFVAGVVAGDAIADELLASEIDIGDDVDGSLMSYVNS